MYLTPEGVDATLAFVVHHAAPGSAIVFDYIYQAVLDGIQRQNEITNIRRYRFMTGEGLTFGIPEGSAESFLRQRGFQQVIDINTQTLKTTYYTGKNADRKVVGGYGIVIGKL
jgi:O-methyltransferase involved in polyketide biosynthesis